MPETMCPHCLEPIGSCARCETPIVESRWASARTPRGHEHYHARCLTPEELRAYQDAGRQMFEQIGLEQHD